MPSTERTTPDQLKNQGRNASRAIRWHATSPIAKTHSTRMGLAESGRPGGPACTFSVTTAEVFIDGQQRYPLEGKSSTMERFVPRIGRRGAANRQMRSETRESVLYRPQSSFISADIRNGPTSMTFAPVVVSAILAASPHPSEHPP